MIFIFGLFFLLLMMKSTQSKAIGEINRASSIEDVKNIFYKYKIELSDQDNNIDTAFCSAARNQILSLKPSKKEIIDIKKWLPSQNENLNIIIVPDLSHRRLLTSDGATTNQASEDKRIIKEILNKFISAVKLKENSKDRIIIDVTDDGQGGEFQQIANNLVIDLDKFKNVLYKKILVNEEKKMLMNLDSLYDMASKKTSGAKYSEFLDFKLANRIRKSDLVDNYKNILIIITDGRFQTGIWPNGTNQKDYENFVYKNSSLSFPVLNSAPSFEDMNVFVFELNAENPLLNVRQEKWWSEWFRSLSFKNSEEGENLHRHEAQYSLTLDNINKIFK